MTLGPACFFATAVTYSRKKATILFYDIYIVLVSMLYNFLQS
jgi:hypothetical protein